MIWNSEYVLSCSIWTGDPLAHSCPPVFPGFPPPPQPDSLAVLVPKTLSLMPAHRCCTQLLPITPVYHETEHPLSLPFRSNTAFPLTYLFSICTNNCYGQVQTTSSSFTWIRYSDLSDFFSLDAFFFFSCPLYCLVFPTAKTLLAILSLIKLFHLKALLWNLQPSFPKKICRNSFNPLLPRLPEKQFFFTHPNCF